MSNNQTLTRETFLASILRLEENLEAGLLQLTDYDFGCLANMLKNMGEVTEAYAQSRFFFERLRDHVKHGVVEGFPRRGPDPSSKKL